MVVVGLCLTVDAFADLIPGSLLFSRYRTVDFLGLEFGPEHTILFQ